MLPAMRELLVAALLLLPIALHVALVRARRSRWRAISERLGARLVDARAAQRLRTDEDPPAPCGPTIAMWPRRGRETSNHDRQGAAAGNVEADRNRGPIGRDEPTSAALSVGDRISIPSGREAPNALSVLGISRTHPGSRNPRCEHRVQQRCFFPTTAAHTCAAFDARARSA